MSRRNSIPTLPTRLTELRRRANLTQQGLAVASGTSTAAVCSLEAGRRSPSLELAWRLTRALGCTLDDLVQPVGTPLGTARKTSRKVAE